MSDLAYRLQKRAEIRRQISTRKSVQEGQPDRIADLLEEAAVAVAERDALKADAENLRSLLKDICDEWDEGCDQSCSSLTHTEECRSVNISKAKMAMRLEIDALKSQLAEAEQTQERSCRLLINLEKQLAVAAEALCKVAIPKRSDGTYNRCREACEELAREALQRLDEVGGNKMAAQTLLNKE